MFDSTGERGPPCGVPSLAGLTSPFSIIPARKNARISFSNPFIADLFGDLREQSVVVDPVEKFLEIQIHHPAVAFAWILLRLLHRLILLSGAMIRKLSNTYTARGDSFESDALTRSFS